MAGAGTYAPLTQISDPKLRAAVKLILDRLGAVEAQAGDIGTVRAPLAAALDAAGNRLTQVADPQHPLDAVNLATLQAYVQAAVNGQIPAQTSPPVPPAPFTPGTPVPPAPPTPTPGPSPGPEPPPSPNPGPGNYPPPQQVNGNIRVAGLTLRNPDGSIYKWKSATDFRLYQYYLDGVDINPVCDNRVASGANMVRCLGMVMPPIATFDPSTYPNYYTKLPEFAAFLAGKGLNLEFTVFASAQDEPSFNELSEQRAHLLAVRDALINSPNVVLELCNEPFQNGVTPSSHTRPIGILSSNGSGSDETPDLPPWDYGTFHAPRDAEWPRKSHNAMELAQLLGRPVINDEPMGAAEVAIPGSRSDVPDDFYYFAAVAMLLAGGGTFHSSNGNQSQVWEPVQQACANSFYAAIDAIPADITTGRYTREPFSDLPIQSLGLTLRTYARYTDHDAVVVAVRPQGGWSAIAQNGWTITSQAGPGGCVVYLAK